MPVRQRTNNQILANNSRAADVATKAIQELLPQQQQKYYNAFRVQGYQGVLYNILNSGPKCSCKSRKSKVQTMLTQDGKAKDGVLNEMLNVGQFGITSYGSNQFNPANDPGHNVSSPNAQNQHLGKTNVDASGYKSFGILDETKPIQGRDQFGANPQVDLGFDINDLVDDFDPVDLGLTDISCPVCFGTGYVGGYSIFNGQRMVLTADDVELEDGELEVMEPPISAICSSFSKRVVLPRLVQGIDRIAVLNGREFIKYGLLINNELITSQDQIMKYCIGQPVLLTIVFNTPTRFTHLELQFNVSSESAYFEFPKLTKGQDISLLEQFEPFQIVLSPNIPQVHVGDLITESVFGKSLVVQNVNYWNTRNRRVLGWEVQVRVCQPQELYRILPTRGRVPTKSQTTRPSSDNIQGHRRT